MNRSLLPGQGIGQRCHAERNKQIPYEIIDCADLYYKDPRSENTEKAQPAEQKRFCLIPGLFSGMSSFLSRGVKGHFSEGEINGAKYLSMWP